MAVTLVTPAGGSTNYLGLASDQKPTPKSPGARFTEADTGNVWVWDGLVWQAQATLLAAIDTAVSLLCQRLDAMQAVMNQQTRLLAQGFDIDIDSNEDDDGEG